MFHDTPLVNRTIESGDLVLVFSEATFPFLFKKNWLYNNLSVSKIIAYIISFLLNCSQILCFCNFIKLHGGCCSYCFQEYAQLCFICLSQDLVNRTEH